MNFQLPNAVSPANAVLARLVRWLLLVSLLLAPLSAWADENEDDAGLASQVDGGPPSPVQSDAGSAVHVDPVPQADAGPAPQVTAPGVESDDSFSFMKLLAERDLHPLKKERWNAYGQFTFISHWKLPFSAAYTNFNGSNKSLLPSAEQSFTGTLTAFLGLALWRGAEVYLVPEVISERPLSDLAGLGGSIQNFELEKTGSAEPTFYRSRFYVRQSIGLGGDRSEKISSAMQLGTVVDSRRVVLTLGNFSVLDFFDKNSLSGDLRRQFSNMSFLTYASYDFAADARGYSWGGIAELYYDDWVLRIGRVAPPEDPNQLPIDFRIYKYYGDQVEVEHAHRLLKKPGVVRLLGYRNRENMGRFDDAISAVRSDPTKNAASCTTFHYGSENSTAPDLCWARRPNVKVGIGVSVEQYVSADVGLFFRGMVSDGLTEVYSYTSTDRSISLGALAKGSFWHRPMDTVGIGYSVGWISQPHADYLNMGGVDGFIGDGKIRLATERVLEVFYSFRIVRSLWISGDYQHLSNPAYNADRGPVELFGVRLHAEF